MLGLCSKIAENNRELKWYISAISIAPTKKMATLHVTIFFVGAGDGN